MPLRAPKMYGFIFGFHRLVWWPKCTPASSSWRMVMPCAACIACCMTSGTGGGVVGGAALVSTFSAMFFLLHLRHLECGPAFEPGTPAWTGRCRNGGSETRGHSGTFPERE